MIKTQLFTKKKIKVNFKDLLILLILATVLVYFSHRVMLTYFFWRDDWNELLLTVTKTYHPLNVKYWFFKIGLINQFFDLLYFKFQNFYLLQWVGLILKIINVVIIYYLIKKLTASRYAAIVGFLFYSFYSGGLEAYSWVRPIGLGIGVLMVFLIIFQGFIYKKSVGYLLKIGVFFLVLYLLLFGSATFARAIGVVAPVLFLIFSSRYEKEGKDIIKSFKRNKFVIIFLLIIFSVLILWSAKFIGVNIFRTSQMIFVNLRIYFGSIGSLLRNPYLYKKEYSALSADDLVSVYFGIGVLIVLFISLILFLKTRKKLYSLLSFSIIWIYSLYFVNWIYGGGGTSTAVGSTHRYLAFSAIGVVFLTSVILSEIPRKLSYILLTVILVLTLRYTKRVTENDYWVRGYPIVGYVYKTVSDFVPQGKPARVINVQVPDILKGPVVHWSFPYAYAYYKKLEGESLYPTFFSNSDIAYEWICGDENVRNLVEAGVGVVDYQKGKTVRQDDIYAWDLAPNGVIVNKTDSFRSRVSKCLEERNNGK